MIAKASRAHRGPQGKTTCFVLCGYFLYVTTLAVDRDLVDDRHDGRVDGTVLGDLRLASRAARRVQHDLANASTDSIHRHGDGAVGVAVDVTGANDEELQALERWLLAARDERADDLAEDHAYLVPLPARPSGRTASTFACGRGMT